VFLTSQEQSFSIRSLVNSESAIYILIHTNLIAVICKKLGLQFISLLKEKLTRDYDEKLVKKIITHKILSILIVNKHKKSSVLMLIVNIKHYEIILKKP